MRVIRIIKATAVADKTPMLNNCSKEKPVPSASEVGEGEADGEGVGNGVEDADGVAVGKSVGVGVGVAADVGVGDGVGVEGGDSIVIVSE